MQDRKNAYTPSLVAELQCVGANSCVAALEGFRLHYAQQEFDAGSKS